MARMAGMLETRIPTAISTTDQFIGLATAIVTSGLVIRAGMKPRRIADVITALENQISNVLLQERSTYKPPTSIVHRSCSLVLVSICRGITIGTESKYTIASVSTPVIAFPR